MGNAIKLSWKERIGYCSGEMAQNIIYQTVSIWLLFYYTNVYGLKPEAAALMFLLVRIIDIVWDPFVGTLVDRSYPRWGKYRSWLIIGGVPLAITAVLCFWNIFGSSLVYAYVTYIALSMCFTLTSVPYGALGDSLTRDVNELTVLTSVRMIFANVAGLLIKTLPLIIAIFAPKGYDTPDSADAWLVTMSIFSAVGMMLLIFCFSHTREKIVMDAKQSAQVRFKDLWTELSGNRPLRVLSLFFVISFATMSISNASDSYFLTYVAETGPLQTSAFMWLGTIPAFIFLPLVPAIKRKTGKKLLFRIFIGLSVLGMAMMFIVANTGNPSGHFILLCISQLIKSTGIVVATGYMWALVPEVVTFGEYLNGRRSSAIITALICIFMKAGMALGGIVPGLVLARTGYSAECSTQEGLAIQGIIWLVTIIPAVLMISAYLVICRYELSDSRVDEINGIVETRNQQK